MSLKEIKDWLIKRMSTENGKNLLVFLVFLCVSAIFWLVLTLNDDYQRDISIPVEITNVPDSVKLLSAPPRSINVSIRDKGSVLAKYQWGSIPSIKISYNDFLASEDNRLTVTHAQISGILHRYFGSNSQVISIKPDSISLSYTTHPGVKVRISIGDNIDANVAPGYVMTHQPYCTPDSVTLYSTEPISARLKSLDISALSYSNLTDSIVANATVNVPSGMRAVPEVVRVTIPVERLERKMRTVAVTVNNPPRGQEVTMTPSEVLVVYLVPSSLRDKDEYPIKVTADYRKRDTSGNTASIPLALSQLPEYYTAPQIFRVDNPDIRLDSIEYVLQDPQ